MRDFLRNLRMPGTRPQRYRTRTTPIARRDVRSWGGLVRRYAVTRVEPLRPRREVHIPWRRIGLALGGVAAVAGLGYGTAWLLTGDTLRVRQIDVNGTLVVNPYAVAAATDAGGDSMLTVDLEAIDRAIEEIPAVKSATVERMWPDALRVSIVEHQAWGYWQAGGQLYTIDREGHLLEASRPAPANAPTIVDVASPNDLAREAGGDGRIGDADTVQLVARLIDDGVYRRLGIDPSTYLFKRDRGLTVVADDGPDAIFGDSSNYQFKVQALEAVLQDLESDAGAGPPQVAEIDLRFGRNVVLR